jgi:GNAT superfamily N-acetyltransferase
VAIEIRPLRATDDRTTFRSGEPDLDRFFVKYAGQNQFRHHIGTTYVAVEDGRLRGFATVAPGTVEGEALPLAARRRLPHYPLPVLRLARLAVDASAQGGGVGAALLRHVFLLALEMAAAYGCVGIVVDAKPEAVAFYERFGFASLDVIQGQVESRPRSTPMFLPLELVALAIKPAR